MKKSQAKLIISFAILLIVVMLMQTVVLAESTNQNFNTTIVVEKENAGKSEFIIYHKDMYKNDFAFAFSKSEDEEPINTEYKTSVKDQNGEEALNVAYIDENIMAKDIFEDNNKSITYLWLKNIENDELVVKGEKINLSLALNDEKIKTVNDATNLIGIDETQTETKTVIEDGVEKTITTGKFVIKENNGEYSYQLLSATDENTNAGKLYNVVELMRKYDGDTFGKLDLTKEFYDLYSNLKPVSDSEWTEVKNNEILQPDGAVDGDKYILWLKKVSDEGTTIDVKLLNCVRVEDNGMAQEEREVTEVVKSPVTYDSIALFVALGIIIVAIVIVLILKKNSKKEN